MEMCSSFFPFDAEIELLRDGLRIDNYASEWIVHLVNDEDVGFHRLTWCWRGNFCPRDKSGTVYAYSEKMSV